MLKNFSIKYRDIRDVPGRDGEIKEHPAVSRMFDKF